MKQLSDFDLANMVGDEFVPDDKKTVRNVRSKLKLSQLIPKTELPAPKHAVLDFHGKTIEDAWFELNHLIKSGTKHATIITGASGILKTEFQKWMRDSIISKYIIESKPLNNGSFEIKIRSENKL